MSAHAYFAICTFCKDGLSEEEAVYCHTCGHHACAEHTADRPGGANECWECTGKGKLYADIRKIARSEPLGDEEIFGVAI
jgi:hypothetical protein